MNKYEYIIFKTVHHAGLISAFKLFFQCMHICLYHRLQFKVSQ